MFKKIFFTVLFAAISTNAHSQNSDSTEIANLKARLDSLEAKQNAYSKFLVSQIKFDQQLTRKNIEAGEYGGFVLSGENTSINIGGLIKTNLTRDFKEMNATNYFAVSQIPVDNGSENKYAMDIGSSRFYINSVVKTDNFNFKTKFEFDFFNTSGQMNFRIRHAYAEAGRFGIGKTYSNYSNINSSPDILDNGGGPGEISIKQIQLRYAHPITNDLRWVFALEESNGVIYGNDNTSVATTLFPDITTNFRYKFNDYDDITHLQLAGVLHPVSYYDDIEERNTKWGWGANIAGAIGVLDGDYIDFQVSYGQGVSKYYNDPVVPFDARLDAATHDVVLKEVYGWFAYYHRKWSEHFASNAGYSYMGAADDKYTLDTDEQLGHYVSANLIYYPNSKIALGAEYIYGVHRNVSGKRGTNGRLQFQALFTF